MNYARDGMGWATGGPGASGLAGWVLTRRRGGAEEDAEKKKQERRNAGDSRVGRLAERAENTEAGSPSFARMDKAEPYPTRLGAYPA
jgi:hypothetical protein